MGIVSDFGGSAYERGRAKVTNTSNTLGFQCLDCGTHRYLTVQEITRAAIQHCLRCGGPLEKTKSSRKREGLPVQSRGKTKAEKEMKGSKKCLECGGKWTSRDALMFHLSSDRDCLEAYRDPNDPMIIGKASFYRNTLYVLELDDKRYEIKGIRTDSELVTIKIYSNKYTADKTLKEIRLGKQIE